MHPGRALPDLAMELARQAQAKRDFLAPAPLLRLSSNGHTDLLLPNGAPYPFAVNEVAHGQIADYLGIPRAFYERLRQQTETLTVPVLDFEAERPGPEQPLFDVLANRLLQSREGDTRLVRTLDGTARAFLSDSFNVDLDNFDVFAVAARAIEEAGLGPENVVSTEVTERKLYLKVVSPKLEAVIRPENLHSPHGGHHLLKEPQVIQAGFIIANSEVGLGSLSVQQTVMKMMCTNLWIVETVCRQRHLGKALEADEDGAVYQSDTRAAEAKARLLKVRDHVADMLAPERFQALREKMQESTEVKLGRGVERVVDTAARKLGLAAREKEQVLEHLIAGADLSLWGLSNAITRTAQDVESYDRATELETLGGRLFALPTGEVKELVRAA